MLNACHSFDRRFFVLIYQEVDSINMIILVFINSIGEYKNIRFMYIYIETKM